MNDRTAVTRRLLSVAVLALVLGLAASCGGSKKKTNTSLPPSATGITGVRPTVPTSTSPVPTPTPKTAASGLTISTADGTHNFYPLITGKNLAGYVTGQVEGPKVRIVSIVAPDAFWIGKGPNQRFLVHINLKGQPTPKIHNGQKVGIIGQLTANPPDVAKQLGVTDSADKSMLGRQGAYLVVSIGDLKLG